MNVWWRSTERNCVYSIEHLINHFILFSSQFSKGKTQQCSLHVKTTIIYEFLVSTSTAIQLVSTFACDSATQCTMVRPFSMFIANSKHCGPLRSRFVVSRPRIESHSWRFFSFMLAFISCSQQIPYFKSGFRDAREWHWSKRNAVCRKDQCRRQVTRTEGF